MICMYYVYCLYLFPTLKSKLHKAGFVPRIYHLAGTMSGTKQVLKKYLSNEFLLVTLNTRSQNFFFLFSKLSFWISEGLV